MRRGGGKRKRRQRQKRKIQREGGWGREGGTRAASREPPHLAASDTGGDQPGILVRAGPRRARGPGARVRAKVHHVGAGGAGRVDLKEAKGSGEELEEFSRQMSGDPSRPGARDMWEVEKPKEAGSAQSK